MQDDLREFRRNYLWSGSPLMLIGTSLFVLLAEMGVISSGWGVIGALVFLTAGMAQNFVQRARLRKTG